MRSCMSKKIMLPLLCASLLGLLACGDEKSNNESNPVTPPTSADNPLITSSGIDPTQLPPSSASTPANTTPTPSGNYAKLAPSANIAVPNTIYANWKAAHFTTLEEDAARYPSLAGDFSDVFKQDFLPAGRVVWSAQTSGGYKAQCSVTNTTENLMKARACTVSEGVGYGMLLSYFAGDDDAFFRLWNYNRAFRDYNSSALMPWIVESFTYNVVDGSSATDADLDVATALILMYYRSGLDPYLQDAKTIVNALWNEEVEQSTKLLLSGNTSMWNGKSGREIIYNLSYFSPVALRLFAMIDPAHDWNGVLDAMYTYMAKVQAGGTGVFPDWSNAAGVAAEAPNGSSKTTYYMFNKESVRIPWRIAWDYYWFQEPRAATVLNGLYGFISPKSGNDPTNLALGTSYSWNLNLGADKESNVVGGYWLGAWCSTGISGAADWLNVCTAELNKKTPSNTTTSYFADILLVMYSQLLNGLFVKPF